MHRALRTKIKSNKGASVSMALLLFLVCAVIGAVVLTAATASAGRFSDLAESDRRYYSVTSAVKLMKNVIENEKAVVVMNDMMNDIDDEIIYGKKAEDQTIFDNIVYEGLKKGETFTNWWAMEEDDVDYTSEKQFTLKVGDKNSLDADVSIVSDKYCNLTVRISSGKQGEQYSQTLVFTPNIDVAVTTQETPTSKTNTKTVRVNWTLTEVK